MLHLQTQSKKWAHCPMPSLNMRWKQWQNWRISMYHLSIPMLSCDPQRLIPLEQSSSPFNQRYHHWGSQIGGHCPLDWIVAWFWLMSCILNLRDCARAHYQSVHNLTFQSFQWCSCAEGVPLIWSILYILIQSMGHPVISDRECKIYQIIIRRKLPVNAM